jgi:hypothetical protein
MDIRMYVFMYYVCIMYVGNMELPSSVDFASLQRDLDGNREREKERERERERGRESE